MPFPELNGESVEYLERPSDAILALSNFRLFIRFKDSFVNVSCFGCLELPRAQNCMDAFNTKPIFLHTADLPGQYLKSLKMRLFTLHLTLFN